MLMKLSLEVSEAVCPAAAPIELVPSTSDPFWRALFDNVRLWSTPPLLLFPAARASVISAEALNSLAVTMMIVVASDDPKCLKVKECHAVQERSGWRRDGKPDTAHTTKHTQRQSSKRSPE
jgi:hypothetical protein